MNVFRVELMIIDHDGLGAEEIECVLENTRYPNHCINPQIAATESRNIGEWEDDNPLNNTQHWKEEFERLFHAPKQAPISEPVRFDSPECVHVSALTDNEHPLRHTTAAD